MRTVAIVAPHFPPSNLAAVHRSRLFAQHLPDFGWSPTVVTVHHDHYEHELDWDLHALLPDDLRVERVGALPTEPVRVVGDIGVRGFLPLLLRLLRLDDEIGLDFVYIPIPSHFAAPLGRLVHEWRGIPYGIDYIDPWVHVWPGSETPFTKHWVSRKLGEWLEPFAVRHASLITGVAPGYYEDVLERNPHLKGTTVTAAMPYGGEPGDHEAIRSLDVEPYVFAPSPNRFDFVYAGALLPRAFDPLDRVCQALATRPALAESIRLHFIGTGTSPDDPEGYNVRPIAEKHGLWKSTITEHPARIPYLDVLVHLDAADGAFVLGSTEPHYTPSKVFQSVLSEKPVLAVLHEASTACTVLRQTGAGQVLTFGGEDDLGTISGSFASALEDFLAFASAFDPDDVDRSQFEEYTARSVTQQLADALDRAVKTNNTR